MFRSSLRLAATASALALAAPAFAQEGAPPAEDEILVTAQRDNQTLVIRGGSAGVLGDKLAEDLPFSIKSYNAALILNQQPQTLGQVLENDPSIRTSYGFGNAAEQFIVRGFVLNGDDIGFDGLYGIAPRQLIAPELYAQVQVLNGASAFLNGAAPGGSGIGGNVNLIPKRAGDTPLTRVTANYTSGSHFGGSFDLARRSASGIWGVRVNGAFRSGDVSVEDEFRQTAVVGGALDYRGADVRVSLDLAYQRVKIRNLRPKVTIATATIPAVPDANHNYGQAFSYTNLRDVFGTLKGEWDVADNALLYASFGARDGSEAGVYDSITVSDAVTGAATGSASYIPRTDNNEAATLGLRVKIAGGGISHEINFGGSYVWQVGRYGYDFLAGYTTNLYATPDVPLPPSLGGAFFLNPANVVDPFPINRTRLGSMFASDTIGLADDRILITGGLRLQKIKTSSYAYLDGSLSGQYSEEAVTPVIGVVVKPVPGLSLFANRIEGLSQGPVAPIDPLVINPGEVFAPYKSTQYEVGGKLGLGRFNISLAAYQTTQPSAYAAPDPAAPGFSRFGIYGEQRNRGIELSMDGEPVDGLRVIAGASLNQAELRNTAGGANDGNTAVGVPDYLVNANVEWDTPFLPGATLTGRFVHTGKQQVNAANTLEIPEWTRFDLGARYVAVIGDTPLTLRFNMDNVANKRYWASAYDAFSAALLQGAPRTFKLSASLDL